ncbi:MULTISPECIES: hypothetical protein [Paenibacillus]|uniref:hypothetical protein n=1 Tax=Paenibacillus TaxID=44249 RepID=UPI0022B8673C|nr:hypothetical protein [Paenibacillus caseinilyticus]MCZ8522211.1 hypothetical protein [Paenibacillus caseinilyticus]
MSVALHPLGYLLCGKQEDSNIEINNVLSRLNITISKFIRKLLSVDLLNEDERELAPFYARTIFEAAGTALLARLDPFRVLIVYKVQSSTNYDVTKRSNVALQWTGDIIASAKPKGDIWNPEQKANDYDRALLSNYFGELFWKPGFLNLIDFLPSYNFTKSSDWKDKLEQREETQFFEMSKTEASNLFSAFSKGVHYEFLVNTESVYDATTVQDFILRMIQITSDLGVVSHFGGLMAFSLSKQEAVDYYLEVEEMARLWRKRMDS